jgi:DNA-binding winged helix-turn-helix (wHTH) protein
MPAFGPFEFDPETHRLTRDGAELHLRPKAFALLALLVEAAPRLVPKRELHERLWPRGVVSDATLVGLVKELRRTLRDRDSKPLIRTVHRVGYALNTEVRERAEPHGMHWLVLNDSDRLLLASGANVIGRDPHANVWLDYATVSRRHARITVHAGVVVLEDLGSKNGTSVAGNRITQSVPLRDGDRLAFGRVAVTYRHSPAELRTLTEVSRLSVVSPVS